MKLVPLLRTLRKGDTRARLSALRAGGRALDVAIMASALRTGVLAEVATGSRSTADLATSLGWSDLEVAEAYLASLAAAGVLERGDAGWSPSPRASRIARDEVASAAYEAFGSYHTELYRQIPQQLTGGPGRQDIERDGELVARLSRFLDEFVLAELDRVARAAPPSRVLDVGCGAAAHLVHVLSVTPDAHGVGVEVDPAAADLAEAAVARAGLGERARIVRGDVRELLAAEPETRFDLVLLANLIYYVRVGERVDFLRGFAERLDPGGQVMVVTTALTDDAFSRHFDLLLRAHDGGRELPDLDLLADQLRQAGLEPEPPRRIAPGEPLTSVVARKR